MNRIVTMLISMFMWKFVNKAMEKGIDYVARRGKPESEMTEAERAQAATGRTFAQRAREIRNVTRRFF